MGDKETPYLVEKLHSEDNAKVSGRVSLGGLIMALALVTEILGGEPNTMTGEGLVTGSLPWWISNMDGIRYYVINCLISASLSYLLSLVFYLQLLLLRLLLVLCFCDL